MFAGSIIKYETEKYKKIDKEGEKRIAATKGLSSFDKLLLGKIQSLISKIVAEIERESGWEYSSSEFTYLSDFNLYDGDIRFMENTVPINFYVPQLNDRELAFVLKYKPLLTRLQTLEEKRRHIYAKGLSKLPSQTIVEPEKRKLFDESFIKSWTEREADKFTRTYEDKGIERLVNNLNDIADKDNIDELYSDFMKQNISDSYKRDLLKWASTYSLKGNILLERFVNYRDRIVNLENTSYFRNK